MDPVARRVACAGLLFRRLAIPVVPAGLPVVWSAMVEDPLTSAEIAWETAAAALMPVHEETRGEVEQTGAGEPAAVVPQAGTIHRWAGEPLHVDAGPARARRVGAAAGPWRLHPAGVTDSYPTLPMAFPPSFGPDRRIGQAAANAVPLQVRQALSARGIGAPPSPEDEPWTGFMASGPARAPAIAHEASSAADGLHAGDASLIAPSSDESPERGAGESGRTRLVHEPGALARLLQANRDPVAAIVSSGPTAWSGAEPGPLRAERELRGSTAPTAVASDRVAAEHRFPGGISTRPAPTAVTSDRVGAEPRPDLAPPVMEAILDELADRLRFEFMREYGTSAS